MHIIQKSLRNFILNLSIFSVFFVNIIAMEETLTEKESQPQKTTIHCYWTSGYFASPELRPIGGNKENCFQFFNCILDIKSDFPVTLITSKPDYEYAKKTYAELYFNGFPKTGFNVVFIEDLISALQDSKALIEQTESFSKQKALELFDTTQTTWYKEVSNNFGKEYGDLLIKQQLCLEESGAIPEVKSQNIFPDFSNLDHEIMMNHYFAFLIKQGLPGVGNPAMASDFLRIVCGLGFAKGKCCYLDIDTLNHYHGNGILKDFIESHVKYAEKHVKNTMEDPLLKYKGHLDFILNMGGISLKTLSTIMTTIAQDAPRKIVIPYFLSSTAWTVEKGSVGTRLKLVSRDYILKLLQSAPLKDEKIVEETAKEISFFNQIGNFMPFNYCQEFPEDLFSERKSLWSFTWKSNNLAVNEIINKTILEVLGAKEISDKDLVNLLLEYFYNDWQYMKRNKITETKYAKELTELFKDVTSENHTILPNKDPECMIF